MFMTIFGDLDIHRQYFKYKNKKFLTLDFILFYFRVYYVKKVICENRYKLKNYWNK